MVQCDSGAEFCVCNLPYTLWLMLIEALCWKLLTRSTFVCGSSHANGPTTLENTVTRSSSFRTRFRPFTPRQPSSNKVIRHCYTLLYTRGPEGPQIKNMNVIKRPFFSFRDNSYIMSSHLPQNVRKVYFCKGNTLDLLSPQAYIYVL